MGQAKINKRAGKTCYWCGAPAVSREHVPPKCIFPADEGFRKNLITVSSCEKHNGAKSCDDAYLFHIIALNFQNNEVGNKHSIAKVIQILQDKPKLANRIFNTSLAVQLKDMVTGKIQETIVIEPDEIRINNALEHIARAIFFHHRQHSWNGSVRCLSEFLITLNTPDAIERNAQLEKLCSEIDAMCAKEKKYGDNPDVFFYQLIEPSDRVIYIRLTFYEGTHVSVLMQRAPDSQ